MVYGLLAAATDAQTRACALAILEQMPELRGTTLSLRDAQTLVTGLLLQKAPDSGLEGAVLDSPACGRYAAARERDGLHRDT